MTYITCKRCNGTKKYKGMGMMDTPCNACDEVGFIKTPENINITSPSTEVNTPSIKQRKKKSDA